MQQRNFVRPYLRNDTMDFFFLNDGNLDKCLSKKKIRLATPALWLSSPHWAKCMTKSKFLETACNNYALIRRRPVTCVYLDLGISPTAQIENWKMNHDARVWVRPRTTTRVELIRCYTGAHGRVDRVRTRPTFSLFFCFCFLFLFFVFFQDSRLTALPWGWNEIEHGKL